MAIRIRKPGILSTVQDLGRTGARRFGINPNGVMDITAARLLNIALGNSENAAVVEMHFPAPEIEFSDETAFAVGGADFEGFLNESPFAGWKVVHARKGSVLRFSKKLRGSRAYLAVAGGFQVGDWLGSSSTNLVAKVGGFHGRKLEAGDEVDCLASDEVRNLTLGRSLIPRYSRFPTVRIVPGAEFEFLTAVSEQELLNRSFKVTANSDRMGFRLQGEPLHLIQQIELLSTAVDFGTIQLLPDGQMIVLMADHQTTGGYPRIAHVIRRDLPLVAQLGPNDALSFHLITLEEAQKISAMFERELAFLRTGIMLRTT